MNGERKCRHTEMKNETKMESPGDPMKNELDALEVGSGADGKNSRKKSQTFNFTLDDLLNLSMHENSIIADTQLEHPLLNDCNRHIVGILECILKEKRSSEVKKSDLQLIKAIADYWEPNNEYTLEELRNKMQLIEDLNKRKKSQNSSIELKLESSKILVHSYGESISVNSILNL
ncbi:MAG: hypothetical protein MHMPM18_000941 [Marteilia pararefringens]